MIRPWFRQAAVPWKTTATQTRASGENRVSTKPGVLHTHVAMEATGIYSMPVYHALVEHGDFEKVLVCNAGHVPLSGPVLAQPVVDVGPDVDMPRFDVGDRVRVREWHPPG